MMKIINYFFAIWFAYLCGSTIYGIQPTDTQIECGFAIAAISFLCNAQRK